ncbi:MAG: FRG domain-containing protein, partial [Taibaiella sp.]|nr:FRG domain-containing protein [Taibaiella sp.]
MNLISIENIDQLNAFLCNAKKSWLYRGQVSHYTDDQGNVSLPSSFDRLGCLPRDMFAWTHYSKLLLSTFSKIDYFDQDKSRSQAILQHYGWRSFFIDLTRSFDVSCWFAANEFSMHYEMRMHEDFE